MATFTDDFNRSDGNLVSPWQAVVGVGCAITSNQMNKGSPAGGESDAVSALIGSSFDNDQAADLEIATLVDSFDLPGVGVRFDAGGTGYVGYFHQSDFQFEIKECTTGTCVVINSVAYAPSLGNFFRLEVIGSTLTTYEVIGGSPTMVGQVMDPTITSGVAAVYYRNGSGNTNNFGDNFSATGFNPVAGGPDGQTGIHADITGISTDGVHF